MPHTSRSALPRPGPACAFGICVLLSAVANVCAQETPLSADSSAAEQLPAGTASFPGLDTAASIAAAEGSQQPAERPKLENPFDRRPVCASMFLKADWQLTGKQQVCDWVQNGVLSTNAMLGAVWSAGFSQRTDPASERGDGFPARFGRKFAQNAFKSTGAYLGGQIFREDLRKTPPYLVMRTSPQAKGFFKRTGQALGGNFVSYRCKNRCAGPGDIHKVPALSRVLGSLASGFAGELLTYDRPDSTRHALRGAASAYGSTFVNALFVEFKPELSAFAGTAFTAIFGVR